MNEAAKIAIMQNEVKVDMQVSEELKQAIIKIGNTELYIRLIDGEYPPFNKIIPEEFITEVELNGQEFENHLKRAQVFAKESSNIIRLKIEGQKMKIIAISPTFGKQEGMMDIKKAVREFFQSGGAENSEAKPRPITMQDLIEALKERKPSVSKTMLQAYQRWAAEHGAL